MNDVARDPDLDRLLHALADPTRRAILSALSDGDLRVTAVAEPFNISLNSVSRHIQTLERSGLVARRRAGREHLLSLRVDRLDHITDWVAQTRNAWTVRLAALDTLLTERSSPTRQEQVNTMTASSPDWITARVVHEFDHAPEVVFDAWLSPGLVREWMGATLDQSIPGTQMVEVEVDPRVGGTFTFTDTRDNGETVPTGTYLEIDRPRRLVFTWLPDETEHSVVKIDIEPTASGCRLTLTHEMEQQWIDLLPRTQATWERMATQIGATLNSRR